MDSNLIEVFRDERFLTFNLQRTKSDTSFLPVPSRTKVSEGIILVIEAVEKGIQISRKRATVVGINDWSTCGRKSKVSETVKLVYIREVEPFQKQNLK